MKKEKIFVLEKGNYKNTSEVLQGCIKKMIEKFNIKVLKTYNFSDKSVAKFSQNFKVFVYDRLDGDFNIRFIKYI